MTRHEPHDHEHHQATPHDDAGKPFRSARTRDRGGIFGGPGTTAVQRTGSTRWSRAEVVGPYSPSGRVPNFTGHGPRGYVRTDAHIREEGCESLETAHAVDAAGIDFSAQSGVVTLAGTVSSRRMKRAAEDRLDRVAGVTDVINGVSVPRDAAGTYARSTHQGRTRA